jgi:RNA polymerase sigma-70 factor (ECF subfamily)
MEFPTQADKDREEHLVSMMNQHGESLLRMCTVYLRDMALAQDAVQETFVKAYKTMDSFRGESGEKTWLTRIAINTCKDMRRAAWYRFVDRRVTLEDVPQPTIDPTADQADLALAVTRLPRKYLDVVMLYYYQGMTIREAAEVLKIPNQTVSARLKRAREKLRTMLEGGQTYGTAHHS